MKFQVGDIAIVKSLSSIKPEYHGREVTVLTGLIDRPKRKGVWHRVDLQGEVGPRYARPQALKRLPSPDLPGSWETSVWKPREIA